MAIAAEIRTGASRAAAPSVVDASAGAAAALLQASRILGD